MTKWGNRMAEIEKPRHTPKILNLISFKKEEQQNFKNLNGKNIFGTLVSVFTSVSLLQAFLISMGVTEVQLGSINIISNAAGIAGMLIVMGIADKVEGPRLIRFLTLSNIPAILLPLVMLVIGIFGHGWSPFAVFIVAVSCWAIYTMTICFRSVLDTKTSPFLFAPSVYGTVFGISGMLMYVVGTLCSFGVKPLLDVKGSVFSGYSFMFMMTIVSILGIMFFSGRLRILGHSAEQQPEDEQTTPEHLTLRNAIRMAVSTAKLRSVLLLHLFRGVVNSMVYFLVPIGMHFYSMSISYAAYITIATMLASFLGYVMVTLLYDKLGSVRTNLLALVFYLCGIGILLFYQSAPMFLLGVFIFSIGHVLLCQCVPLGAFKVTPRKIMGSMTVFRLVIMQCVEAVCTFMLGIYIAKISICLILGIVTVALLLQGLLVYLSYSGIPSENRPKPPKRHIIPLQ